MKFIIYLNNQEIKYEADPTLEQLIDHITLYLAEVPKKSFALSYIDEEGDKIDLTSDDDIVAMKQSMSQYPEIPIFINSQDELRFNQAWECQCCTFINDLTFNKCVVCDSQKNEQSNVMYHAKEENLQKSRVCKINKEIKQEKVPEFKPNQQVLKNVQDILEPVLQPLLLEKKKSSKKELINEEFVKNTVSFGKMFVDVISNKKKENKKQEQKNEKKIKSLKSACDKFNKEKKEQRAKKVALAQQAEQVKQQPTVFTTIEKNLEQISQEFVEGKIDEKQFNIKWVNEATILKKRVMTMKAMAIKQQQEKAKSSSLTEMQKKKQELEKQIKELNESIVVQEKKEAEVKLKQEAEKLQKEQAKQQQVQQKQVVNNLKELKYAQEVSKTQDEKLQAMVNIYGGKPSDYQEILYIFPDASIEDLCDAVIQMKEAEREKLQMLEDQLYC